jgi:hypothetical protein
LRQEIRALLAEDRPHPAVSAPARIEYSPATAAWLARRHSQ